MALSRRSEVCDLLRSSRPRNLWTGAAGPRADEGFKVVAKLLSDEGSIHAEVRPQPTSDDQQGNVSCSGSSKRQDGRLGVAATGPSVVHQQDMGVGPEVHRAGREVTLIQCAGIGYASDAG